MEKVLIVDDQRYFCQMAREILSKCSQFAVVGETYDASHAMEMVEELKPDVVLMDVEMEGINGLEAAQLIRRHHPATRVVLMSLYDKKEYSRLAARVGARAFITKKDISAPLLSRVLKQESFDASVA